MRRFAIGLAILLALSLMLAAVAIAAPPGDYCDISGSHPKCTTTTSDPTTPPTTVAPDSQPCAEGQFTVAGGREQVLFECDWAPVNDGASQGIVTVSGEVSRVVVMVRDSSPGDLCELSWPGKTSRGWEWYEGPLTGALDLTFPLTDTRGIYWDFDYMDNNGDPVMGSTGEHWCGLYDPIDGLRDDLNGDPLHLFVILDGNKNKNKENASVNVTLSPNPVQEVTP